MKFYDLLMAVGLASLIGAGIAGSESAFLIIALSLFLVSLLGAE